MKGFAYLGEGKTGWVEKERPRATGVNAVVRPIAIAPCSSDVHNVEMGFVAPGRILGHEGVGEVVEVGPDVRDFRPGDRVVLCPMTPDWRTLEAQQGVYQHGGGLFQGQVLSTVWDGVMAEYTLIRDADMNLALLPDEISLSGGAMIGDMMSTGFSGAELADVEFGDTVVVIGIGPVGLMAVAGARSRGAGRIIAIGSRPVCVEAARHFGANEIVNYKDGDIVKQINALTNKKGADKCIIAGGGNDALNQALAMVRWGGSVGNINYYLDGTLDLSVRRFGYGMGNKTIRGGHCPGGRLRMEKLISLVRHTGLDLERLVTQTFRGLEETEAAFALMEQKPADVIKPVVLV